MAARRKARVVVYRARDGWRWRLIAANNRIIATGEAHTRRADAERAAAAVQRTFAALQEATCSPN